MHFYCETENGVEPRHYVPMASRPNDIRPTRITDVRKWWKQGELVVPSVTTVLNVLDKAALNNWKVDQHLAVAHAKHGDLAGMAADEYRAEVKRLTELEMDKAPSAGTDMHKLMEDFVNGDMDPSHEMRDFCHKVCWAVECETGYKNNAAYRSYLTEQRFVAGDGYGGCADLLVCESWVIDYKTKQTADKFKPGKMAYPDHHRQLAAYRRGLGLPKARCANVFICLETGEVDFHEHTEDDLQRGWEVFVRALEIWQINNGWPESLARAA